MNECPVANNISIVMEQKVRIRPIYFVTQVTVESNKYCVNVV